MPKLNDNVISLSPSIDDYLYYYITPTPFREFAFGLRWNDLMMLLYKVIEKLVAIMFVPYCYFIIVRSVPSENCVI